MDLASGASDLKTRDRAWWSDFAWREGRVEIRKTAIRLKLDRDLIAEVLNWIGYLAILAVAATLARIRRARPMAVRFAPDQPRPWYLLRGAALWAGVRMTAAPAEAAATFYFDDVTAGPAPLSDGGRAFNFACTDISKSHVAEVFEAVFGYPLRLDPTTAVGDIVEKSEKNGVHDGAIVRAPLTPRPGYVYQRLVDTQDDSGRCQDLRTPCVGGEPVLVWVKTKAAGGRFAIHNRQVSLRDPGEIFSAAEMAAIRRFNARMGLDWGGLDILRDRQDGRIYVVDVNKTDVGPIIALSWRDKIRSMNRLAAAFERLVAGGESNPCEI
ncbi:MAG: hypothetical protein KKC14_15220 [Alphaproteobacteria bacterium]|nr:hypothetical protein [Alphaproteobacteria bacterium]